MSWRSATLILAVILLACTAGVYLPARHFQFVDYDDVEEVIENPLLHPPSGEHLREIWTRPYLRLYAPLTYSAWWGMSRFEGMADNPAAFHTLSILLHLVCAGLVYSILLRCVGSPVAAFGGATLFALHPLQVESVAWVAETNNLLAAALALGAIWIFLEADGPAWRWWILYGVATTVYLLALYAKPTAVVTPVVAGVLAIGILRRPWKKVAGAMTVWLVVAGIFGWVAHRAQNVAFASVTQRPVVAIDAIAFYVEKLIWPMGLGIDYGRTPAKVVGGELWVVQASVVAALVAVLVLMRKSHRGVAIGGLVMLGALLPVLGLVPFSFQEYSTVADRFIYLAMLGPALALATMLARIRWQPALAVVAAMGLVLTWLTAGQLAMWRDTDALVRHTLANDPGSTLGNAIAGAALNRAGRPAEAVGYFASAIARDPTDADYHFNLGNALRDCGKFDESIKEYHKAISLSKSPNLDAMNNLGVAYVRSGQPELAKQAFDQVLSIDPGNQQAIQNLRILAETR